MNAIRHMITRGISAAVVLGAAAAPALAQIAGGGGGDAGPPMPTLNRSPHPAWGYGIMFILLVAVIAVSIMPSKRGHQD